MKRLITFLLHFRPYIYKTFCDIHYIKYVCNYSGPGVKLDSKRIRMVVLLMHTHIHHVRFTCIELNIM